MVQSGTRGVLADALDIVLRSTDLNWEYVQKIKIMQEALQTGTVSGGTRRFDLYAESIAGFLQNPLFGNVSGLCGGHSAILDSLARFGAIGTIPWLMVIYCVYRQMRQTLYPSNPNGVALGAVFLIPWIFTMVVDPSIGRRVYAAYFIILPGLSLFLIEGMQTKAHRCTRWGAAPIDTPQGGSSHRGHLSVSRV
jgi:O-antigen ligase